jgi:hypothetical protein
MSKHAVLPIVAQSGERRIGVSVKSLARFFANVRFDTTLDGESVSLGTSAEIDFVFRALAVLVPAR